ncbi:mannose-6-phosphate isomerase, class I [Halobacillus litoralis]|uniref:mannose-6-phosphate isomerase, class I n=1 Tax=Halobacillus litoralis TaxID=45668 RepID=UPI001CFCFA77|nr:mannose-6-phosphate isomerase, class I [Halobacillus litoralis]WLR46625.1 mannose-6-phosphate isomerase, class I [Halobacillus litoralis]
MEPIFLKPTFKERIWGGQALKDQFHYSIPSNKTGECWAISAHPNGPSVVENGAHSGKTLDVLWKDHPELFGNPEQSDFPLLTKIIDANMDLSVQVHPDDDYNLIHSGEPGKTECWYILDCDEGAELIFGHTALNKDQFIEQVRSDQWGELLKRIPIEPGDFFYVPSGTLHAIGKGTLVLETQQSSDTTYRVYDFNRVDEKGQKRELHIDQAVEVATIPHQEKQPNQWLSHFGPSRITRLVQSPFFNVYKWEIRGSYKGNVLDQYLLVSIIEGEGSIVYNDHCYAIQKGTHFLLPAGLGEYQLIGNLDAIVSHN